MVVRIVISGESQCEVFAELCLVSDYLSQKLPNFCFDRIEKSVKGWKPWLCKINQKNKWHHEGSPLVWKELLMKGSKPYYIGGAPEFFEYCHSYYNFDLFISPENFEGLVENFSQYQNKVKEEKQFLTKLSADSKIFVEQAASSSTNKFVVSISGAANPLTMHLISGLMEMSDGEKSISKIYIYDSNCSQAFMESVEYECSFIGSNNPGKVVKYVEKIGVALTHSDLLIILDHVPFDLDSSIGNWLHENMKIMHNLALVINASASRKMYILFPNLGPACFNATVLMHSVTASFNQKQIVVATSDLGLDIVSTVSEIAGVPMRNIFCPPVWGFVGINHLVDIRTTIHKYNSFEPYNRYRKVRNSTLTIGSLTPEMRTMEYLMHFDESLWMKVTEKKNFIRGGQIPINKALATLSLVKMWLFDPNPEYIVNLGVKCDGSFGLKFDGAFSQPVRFEHGIWKPAGEYMLPKDKQMKLPYLEQIANIMMQLSEADLPKIVPFYPCSCKRQFHKRKHIWF